MVREDDSDLIEVTSELNDPETQLCTGIERELLNEMEAGCSAPVGAFAWMDEDNETVHLKAAALKVDGSLSYDIETSSPADSATGLGRKAAQKLLGQGADKLVEEMKK
jgi:hydroxymethylbilane synthase